MYPLDVFQAYKTNNNNNIDMLITNTCSMVSLRERALTLISQTQLKHKIQIKPHNISYCALLSLCKVNIN